MSCVWRSRLLAAAIAAIPVDAAAQLTVIEPRPGQAISYRRAQIVWEPMPGVAGYHLQVDDDPAFRSPEIDVVVQQTHYVLSGDDRLRLNGQLSWATYVRVNGLRWSVPTFAPSYVTRAYWPSVAAGPAGQVYYAYLTDLHAGPIAMVRTSDDFSSAIRLSPAVTDTNPHGIAMQVDGAGVAHVFWTEQIEGRGGLPFHASSVDWQPSQVSPDGVGGVDGAGPSMVITQGRIEVFEEGFGPVQQFTSLDGETFAKSTVPDSSFSVTAHAAADVPGGIVLAEERLGNQVVLQRSQTGWAPEPLGQGEYPSVAVGADGVVHVVKRQGVFGDIVYSNSARGFTTWTLVPFGRVLAPYPVPIVVDDARSRIYVAAPVATSILLCGSGDAGASWSCRRVGGNEPGHPDLKLDASGVLHIAWAEARGGGYATSLGSFLAVNHSPQALLSEGTPWPNTMIIPASVADADGDAVGGSVAVGVNELRRVRLFRNDQLPLLGDEVVFGGTAIFAINRNLLFRAPGRDWVTVLALDDLGFPARVEVQTLDGRAVDVFTIRVREAESIVVDHWEFTAHVREPFSNGRLPRSIGIGSAPAGLLTMRVAVHDDASRRVFDAPFVRVEGRDHLALVDFRPGAESFLSLLDTIPLGNFTAPVFRSVLGSEMNGVVFAIERALIAAAAELRADLLDAAENRLRSRVLGRIDGCAASGKPDDDDWVLDCGDQRRLVVAAAQVLHAIGALR